MVTATIFEAKTRLSELIRKAQNGETVVITSGRDKKPVARLEAVDAAPAKKRLGLLQIPGYVPDDSIFEPLPDAELKLWEGENE
jgi:antitoxin (DNA-binding transcriptional repressor) of toxin-antitoxin stability system